MAAEDLLSLQTEKMLGGSANNPSSVFDVAGARFDALLANQQETAFWMKAPYEQEELSNRSKLIDERLGGVEQFKRAARSSIKKETWEDPDQYLVRVQREEERLSDEAINRLRDTDFERSRGLKTSEEIRAVFIDRAQIAQMDAEITSAMASGSGTLVAGELLGGVGGVMIAPTNLLTLPFGAASSAGVLRGALTDGVINASIEAFQAPGNMEWRKEIGMQYSVGDALTDVAFAGIGGGAISGVIRGIGKALPKNRNKSLDVLDRISRDKNLPSEVRDAAQYQASIAHVDESIPLISRDSVSDTEVAANRQNLESTADAILANRDPEIDPLVFDDPVAPRISQLQREIAELEREALLPAQQPVLPRSLAGAKPRYKQSSIEFENDVDKALYITSQNKKSKADAQYREFLSRAGLSDADIAKYGQQVRVAIKAAGESSGGDIRLPRVFNGMADNVNKIAQEISRRQKDIDILSGKRTQQPSQAKTFETGEQRGQRFAEYTKLTSRKTKDWVDAVVTELNDAYKGARLFSEAKIGGAPDITGYKGGFPVWFKELGKEISLSREKVNIVYKKMLNGKPLGKAEVKIAEAIYNESVAMRELNARQYQGVKAARMADNEESIDAIAGREEGLWRINDGIKDDAVIDDTSFDNYADFIEQRAIDSADAAAVSAFAADFQRLLRDFPDLEIMDEGGIMKSVRELAEENKNDEIVVQAIKTCGVG